MYLNLPRKQISICANDICRLQTLQESFCSQGQLCVDHSPVRRTTPESPSAIGFGAFRVVGASLKIGNAKEVVYYMFLSRGWLPPSDLSHNCLGQFINFHHLHMPPRWGVCLSAWPWKLCTCRCRGNMSEHACGNRDCLKAGLFVD